MSATARTDSSGRFAYDGLERVIHEKARLGILASLIAHPDGLLFNDLKDLCSLTDGNLSAAAAKTQAEEATQIERCADKRRAGEEWLARSLQDRFTEQERQQLIEALGLLGRLTQP